jgi:carbon-monoxide dehydrogenase large subunit
MTVAKFGQALPRIEDRKLLTGQGCYIDDISLPGMAHGAIVYSTHASAKIRSIETKRSLQAPGVLAVLTGKDVAARGIQGLPPLFMPEDSGGPKGHRTIRPLLAEHTVRHVGDRVAICIAETPEQARDGAELVEIEYEPLPCVSSVTAATAPDAPLVWDAAAGNICFTLNVGDPAATENAFATATHRVRLRLTNNRVTACPMEPRGAIGCYSRAEQSYVLYSSTQNPHRVRETLARLSSGFQRREFA